MNHRRLDVQLLLVGFVAALVAAPGCGRKEAGRAGTDRDTALVYGDTLAGAGGPSAWREDTTLTRITVESSAFPAGGDIPSTHTCDGADASPPLSWGDPPAGTMGWAVVCDDPDAPGKTWIHWVLFDLPAAVRQLPPGAGASDSTALGGKHGMSDFGRMGYGGPCPPPGAPHRYSFRVYALSRRLELPAGRTLEDVQAAMAGNVLAWGELVGTYGRS
jgi:Raf kinase inhibitor-like YbhB/YbcL family protein